MRVRYPFYQQVPFGFTRHMILPLNSDTSIISGESNKYYLYMDMTKER